MAKRAGLALLAVFILWSILDFVIHGVLLRGVYAATPSLWRPMAEMSFALMNGVTLVRAMCFVGIYWFLVAPRTLGSGLRYGLLFGIGTGVSMGFGSYCSMPIPLTLALGWSLGTLVDAVAAGAIVGAIVRRREA
jgi:hypothetical protein